MEGTEGDDVVGMPKGIGVAGGHLKTLLFRTARGYERISPCLRRLSGLGRGPNRPMSGGMRSDVAVTTGYLHASSGGQTAHLVRHLAWMLALVSAADVVTTAVALSLGAAELSPGGAAVIAVAGIAGLVAMKLLAVVLVWVLNRGWPAIGRSVGAGLTIMTGAAVAWNLYTLTKAGLIV
jgi:hypothetical protein